MIYTPPKPPTQLQGITDLIVLATIKPGLVDGIFDSRSHAWRLERVLGLLDAARRAAREVDEQPSPFVDGVARLRGIHAFRFAIVPGDPQRLLLNVTFDGGWEPYMRLIWGPLGTMLDLIFCHCEGYPRAFDSSFDDYIGWVRQHEIPSQFLYLDSCATVADRAYFSQLQAQQHTAGCRADADLRAARLALEAMQPPQPTPGAAIAGVRMLSGLHALRPLFARDDPVLLRFTQDYLSDLRVWIAQGLFDPGQRFDALRPVEDVRAWLMQSRDARPRRRDRAAAPSAAAVQAGILQPLKAPAGRFARGALALARVADPARARHWLSFAAATRLITDGETVDLDTHGVTCTVAITYTGLRRLGVTEANLQALPGEFVQGMEARAATLGDVRGNHPQRWARPKPSWPAGRPASPAPLDLAGVHLTIQLRTAESDGESVANAREALLPRLEVWLRTQLQHASGIEVLAVEPMWGRPGAPGALAAADHFGFADGISQPAMQPSASSAFWDDSVKTGELLLGWVNDRGDGPLEEKPAPPGWLDDGTFFVVRKIRQHPERLDAVVDKAAQRLEARATSPEAARELVRSKLLGRASDGTPVVAQRGHGANDFDYRFDSDGASCPFASHVRRANPRGGGGGAAASKPPRIVRRGMSYGLPAPSCDDPKDAPAERGTLFMAYNASIAEQFEVIQRWLTGGNSSGVASSLADPLLGVPRTGEPTVFRFCHGDEVVRVELGDRPICQLQWGLYAFVPSMSLLREFEARACMPPAVAAKSSVPPAAPPTPPLPSAPQPSARDLDGENRQRVKADFEDENRRDERWKKVRRDCGGVEKIGTTVLVGSHAEVLKVLGDDGTRFSAGGYGDRMGATLGRCPFGMDDAGPKSGHAVAAVVAIKRAVAGAVDEADALAAAYVHVRDGLAELQTKARALGASATSVDVLDLGVAVVAKLCVEWFGVVFEPGHTEEGITAPALPAELAPEPQPVRVPGHLLSVARYVFSADPNPTVKVLASVHGPALRVAVASWVQHATNARQPAPVLKAVLDALRPWSKDFGRDEREAIVANVILGMPATWLGSWGKVLRAWIADRRLWQLQQQLGAAGAEPPDLQSPAVVALRAALIATMAADPVADGIWRTAATATKLGDTAVQEGDVVWLGLASALRDGPVASEAVEALLFGGALDRESPWRGRHACPGRGMAVGALLGALAALLQAGEWAPTASPTTLMLKKPR